MALHNIKIIVVDGGKSGTYQEKNASSGGDSTSSTSSKSNAQNSKLYQMFHAKETVMNKMEASGIKLKNSATLMGLSMTAQLTKQVVSQTMNYYISDIGRKSGDSNYQNMVSRNIEIASEVTGVLGGALSGATAGSMFAGVTGGLSVVVGAVLGAASSGISTAFKYGEKNRAYQWELFQQNTSQSYNLARANYSATSGRLR